MRTFSGWPFMEKKGASLATQQTVALDDDRADSILGGAPAPDRNRAFELAELERRLFGTGEVDPFRVGRFTVMEKLGSGGMGVVYAAFDPQLERKIAVKFLRSDFDGDSERGAARLLREAQALARLGHPNVVSVFDVGTYEGGVYVAMEFIQGESLSQWVREAEPEWSEILSAYLQAGQGLAAAHRAGIVHRDFKPDNALRDHDGRVRVLDFGLAAPTDAEIAEALSRSRGDGHQTPADTGAFSDPRTRTGAVMGTPLYMAPEQHLGERADARCDQFAFCVSLWISIFGSRPFRGETMAALAMSVTKGQLQSMPRNPRLPPRVRAAITRGLASDPKDRFPTIDELLSELDVGAQRRRTFAFAGSGLGLAAAIGGLFAWQLRGEAEPSLCEQSGDRIERAWNESRAMDATARFAKTDADKTWHELRDTVDRHAGEWKSAQRQICTEPEIDLEKMACLDWRLQELETFSELLAKAPPEKLHLIAQGAAALESAAACSNRKALALMVPPPRDPARREEVQELRTEIARARILHKSGEHDRGLDAAEAVTARAHKLDEAGVEAESLLLLGEVLYDAGRGDEAEDTLRKAVHRAEAASHDEARARGLGLLIEVVGFGQGRPTAELEDRFESVRQRFGDLPSRAVVDYLLALTMVRIGHGRVADATRIAEEAVEEIDRLGLEGVKAQAQLGLALTLSGRYRDARKVLDAVARRIDDHHPSAVFVLGVTGIHRGFVGIDREAIDFFKRALALEATHKLGQPHYRALVGTYMANSVDRLGDSKKARIMQQASIKALQGLWGPDHSALGRAYYHYATTLADAGEWEDAREAYEQTLRIWKMTHGENHRAVAYPETGLARVLLHDGKHPEALRLMEEAYPKLAGEMGHPSEDARTAFHLARALQSTGHDPERAQSLARSALESLSGLGPGYERDREAIRHWQAEHPPGADPSQPAK
jgi:tetratricopeptide (TPR) repeat protein